MKQALALALLLAGCHKKSEPSARPATPQVSLAPSPALPPIADGATITSLLAKHRGQPIVVNVFASWCVPCRSELPDLARLKAQAPRLYLLGIDVDSDAAAAAQFVPSLPAGMEVVRAPEGVSPLLPAFHLPNDWNESMPPAWDKTVPLTFAFSESGEFETGSVGQLGAEALQALREIAHAH